MIFYMTLTDGTQVQIRCGETEDWLGMDGGDATAASVLQAMEADNECEFQVVEDIDQFVVMFQKAGADIELIGVLEEV